LADDMGLGKTVQAISLLAQLLVEVSVVVNVHRRIYVDVYIDLDKCVEGPTRYYNGMYLCPCISTHTQIHIYMYVCMYTCIYIHI